MPRIHQVTPVTSENRKSRYSIEGQPTPPRGTSVRPVTDDVVNDRHRVYPRTVNHHQTTYVFVYLSRRLLPESLERLSPSIRTGP